MKKIECVIPSARFPELEKKLRHTGIRGMTVTDVKGYGNEQTRPESFLLLPKTKIELFCTDEECDPLLEIILDTCKSNHLGAGKVAVMNVEEMIRIRTGERGAVAV